MRSSSEPQGQSCPWPFAVIFVLGVELGLMSLVDAPQRDTPTMSVGNLDRQTSRLLFLGGLGGLFVESAFNSMRRLAERLK